MTPERRAAIEDRIARTVARKGKREHLTPEEKKDRRRKHEARRQRALHAGVLHPKNQAPNPPAADVAARFRDVPQYDTRDLTARVLGDPLPGRSALDREGAG